MSFRILDVAPQYLLPDGRVNAGGSLTFYETDLSTPKDTWSNEALSVLNPNPVILDAAGRTVTDVWGDGEYGVVMRDALGVVIWTRNNVRDIDNPGQAIPALVGGAFLTNDGSIMSWQPILQVPDPTGSDGNVLYSDGLNAYWAPLPVVPEPPEPDWDVTTDSLQLGDLLIQWGTATASGTGSFENSASVTFPETYDTAPLFVSIQVRDIQYATVNALVAHSARSVSASGFEARFNIATRHGVSDASITTPIPFFWLAIGTKAA